VKVFNIFLIWIHLTAATFWVGGMLFLSLVAVPLLKKDVDPLSAQRSFGSLARRFRTLVWVALVILVLTGSMLLPRLVLIPSSPLTWPPTVLWKLFLVLTLIGVSLLHDQVVGPKVLTLKRKADGELTRPEQLVLRLSPLLARLTLVLGLAVLLAAVMLVRM